MKITLTLNNKPIGFIEYEMINDFQFMGVLKNVVTNSKQLTYVIQKKIKNNTEITIMGGHSPQDLSKYFDGIVLVLEKIKEEISGFSYLIPKEENPYLMEIPEEFQGMVH